MSRDPTVVIDSMLVHIPESRSVLRAELKRIRSNACYVAPECMGRIWDAMATSLEAFLSNPPKLDWELKVAEIMRGGLEG